MSTWQLSDPIQETEEPGTLQFDILVPQEEADTIMLYEVYAGPEAFQTHWNGTSLQRERNKRERVYG